MVEETPALALVRFNEMQTIDSLTRVLQPFKRVIRV